MKTLNSIVAFLVLTTPLAAQDATVKELQEAAAKKIEKPNFKVITH